MFQRPVRVILLGLLLAFLIAGGITARPDSEATEPAPEPSGPITGLAVDAADGNLLMVRGGLFRSADQGKTWSAVSFPSRFHPDKLRQVATTTAVPDSLYTAGPGAGILRSNDGGESWDLVSDGLPSQDVGAFAVHSFRPDTLYAWIEEGIFRSEDGGGRWEKMDAGPPTSVVTLVHSTLEGSMDTGWLYAATPDGPYLSMDCF
ncbi:MAG: WD40/YVTN/BNR-like repeat-containing protein [Thermomicrobiales bacterium]